MRISSFLRKAKVVVPVTLLAAAIGCQLTLPSRAQTGRYVLNGGEAYDRKTGLIWQRCCVGSTWQNGRCAGQQRSMTLFDALALKDGKWRVPTRMELESLFEDRPDYPKIDTQVFAD